MKNYKAYSIVSVLTQDELKLFESFLKSPYHNTRKKPVELFQIIKRSIRKPEAEISKQKAFEKLYPGKKFNANTFNDLMSQLYNLVEEFLFIQNTKKDKIKKETEILGIFLDGRFHTLFENKKKQLDKIMSDSKMVESFFFWNSFLKEAYNVTYFQLYKNIKSKKDISNLSEALFEAAINLTNLYVEEILASFLQTQTRRFELSNSNFDVFIKEIIVKIFESKFLDTFEKKNKHHFYIMFSKYLFDLYSSRGDKKTYLKYKTSLIKNSHKLTHAHITYQYTYLLGYCTRQVRTAKNSFFYNEIYSLFEEIVSKKYYSHLKISCFRPKLYSSFLNSFLLFKDIDQIQKMIDICVPLLEKKHIHFYKNLSLSYICFLSKNYNKALELVNDINPSFKDTENGFKIYSIKLHYLSGNTEQALNFLDSYIKYSKSYSVKDKMYSLLRSNFAKYVKKITLLKNKSQLEELKYLQKKIESDSQVHAKDWLLEIIAEALNKKSNNSLALS